MERNFMQLLDVQQRKGKFVCVGLDSDTEKLPDFLKKSNGSTAQIKFNEAIVSSTKDLICAYKINTAFYEEGGTGGWFNLKSTIEIIRDLAPDVPIILDAKRGDIGNTNNGYVKMAFDYLGADAITVHPYLGEEALKPFLERTEKGIIVLCRTSNPGADEFQDITTLTALMPGEEIEYLCHVYGKAVESISLYEYIALRVAKYWNRHGNCAVVVGATYPYQLTKVRKIVHDMPILIPGIGAQGGDLEATILAGKNGEDQGMIINLSRSVMFASSGEDFAEAARAEVLRINEKMHLSLLKSSCRLDEGQASSL